MIILEFINLDKIVHNFYNYSSMTMHSHIPSDRMTEFNWKCNLDICIDRLSLCTHLRDSIIIYPRQIERASSPFWWVGVIFINWIVREWSKSIDVKSSKSLLSYRVIGLCCASILTFLLCHTLPSCGCRSEKSWLIK